MIVAFKQLSICGSLKYPRNVSTKGFELFSCLAHLITLTPHSGRKIETPSDRSRYLPQAANGYLDTLQKCKYIRI